MKTINHLIAIASIAIIFSSCQKSMDQMVPVKKASTMAKSRDINSSELWSKIYPFVNEPYYTKLGYEDSYLNIDEKPVFYVLLSDQVTTDGFQGTLTLRDVTTSEIMGTYDLVPYYDPSVANVIIPDDLKEYNLPYMFVRVTFDPEIFGHTVDMVADITLINGDTNNITLAKAFTVK